MYTLHLTAVDVIPFRFHKSDFSACFDNNYFINSIGYCYDPFTNL